MNLAKCLGRLVRIGVLLLIIVGCAPAATPTPIPTPPSPTPHPLVGSYVFKLSDPADTIRFTFGADGTWSAINIAGPDAGLYPSEGTYKVTGDQIVFMENDVNWPGCTPEQVRAPASYKWQFLDNGKVLSLSNGKDPCSLRIAVFTGGVWERE